MGNKLLIIEDEKNISDIISINAEINGYVCDAAFDGETGYNMARTDAYDLILLDIMLPKMDGYEVCRRLRSDNVNTPVIMVTAREQEADKVLGLELGADDYISKPFSVKELMARIKANIRRSSGEVVTGRKNDSAYTVKNITIDNEKYEIKKNGEPIKLSKNEYELLSFLAKNADKVFSREDLLESVWGYESFYGTVRTVDVTIHRLRAKIEDDPSNPTLIITVNKKGWYLNGAE